MVQVVVLIQANFDTHCDTIWRQRKLLGIYNNDYQI